MTDVSDSLIRVRRRSIKGRQSQCTLSIWVTLKVPKTEMYLEWSLRMMIQRRLYESLRRGKRGSLRMIDDAKVHDPWLIKKTHSTVRLSEAARQGQSQVTRVTVRVKCQSHEGEGTQHRLVMIGTHPCTNNEETVRSTAIEVRTQVLSSLQTRAHLHHTLRRIAPRGLTHEVTRTEIILGLRAVQD